MDVISSGYRKISASAYRAAYALVLPGLLPLLAALERGKMRGMTHFMADEDKPGLAQVLMLTAEIRERLAFEAVRGTVGFFPLPPKDAVRGHGAMGGTVQPTRGDNLQTGQSAVAAVRQRSGDAGSVGANRKGPEERSAGNGADEALAATAAGAERETSLAVLAEQVAACTDCQLHEQRKQSVFARGNSGAELVFVGEGPGRDEDLRGLPFVGAAGQLLDRMVGAMGFTQDEIYICNVVKCRPPQNRTPSPEEAKACSQFLVPQIDCVAPKVIVALGRCAAENLGVAPPQGGWRGRWCQYRGIPVMPTYHPAFLLRSPEFKKVVWQDLQQVMSRLGRARP